MIMECPYCALEMPVVELEAHVRTCKAAQEQLRQRKQRAGICVGEDESADFDSGPVRLPDGRMRCQFCNRGFSLDRIHKHVSICGKLNKAKPRTAEVDLVQACAADGGAERKQNGASGGSSPSAARRQLRTSSSERPQFRKPLVQRGSSAPSVRGTSRPTGNHPVQSQRGLLETNDDLDMGDHTKENSGDWRAKHREVVKAIRNARQAATKGGPSTAFFASKAETIAGVDEHEAAAPFETPPTAMRPEASESSMRRGNRSQSQRSQRQRIGVVANSKRPPKPRLVERPLDTYAAENSEPLSPAAASRDLSPAAASETAAYEVPPPAERPLSNSMVTRHASAPSQPPLTSINAAEGVVRGHTIGTERPEVPPQRTQTVWEPTTPNVSATAPPEQSAAPRLPSNLLVNRRSSESDLPTMGARTPATPPMRYGSVTCFPSTGQQGQVLNRAQTPSEVSASPRRLRAASARPVRESEAISSNSISRRSKEEEYKVDRTSSCPAFAELGPGVSVQVQGLATATHLNGLNAILLDFDADANCWLARLDSGEVKALRPEHIVASRVSPLLEESASSREPADTNASWRQRGMTKSFQPEHMVSSRVIPYVPLASSMDDSRVCERRFSGDSPRKGPIITRAARVAEAPASASLKLPVQSAWQASESTSFSVPQQFEARDVSRGANRAMSYPGNPVVASSTSRATIPRSANAYSSGSGTTSARDRDSPPHSARDIRQSRIKSPRGLRPPSPQPNNHATSPQPSNHATAPSLAPACRTPVMSQRPAFGSNFNSLSAPAPPMVGQHHHTTIPANAMPPCGFAPSSFGMDAVRSSLEARVCQPRHIGGQGTPARTITAAPGGCTPAVRGGAQRGGTPMASGFQPIGMVPPPLRPSIQYT